LTPEDLARQNIDRQLEACGWIIQDFSSLNIMAGVGVAVREYQLTTGEADYGLYIDGKVAGVIEAKKEGSNLTGVETQTDKYAKGLPDGVPHYGLPLPFGYESTGVVTRFTNRLNPYPRSREVFTFHRPEELKRLLNIGDENQLRSRLLDLPELEDAKLWPIQRVAITNLEKSLSENRPRSLIQMTMGSGKTFTAVSAVYRLIKFAGASRILFLVDRNNLGKQTDKEFQSYVSPYNNYKFTEEYPVQRLTKNAIGESSKVVITTIQRLYSMLQGDEDFDEQNEEGSFFEGDEMGGSTYRTTMVKDKKSGYTTAKEKGEYFKKQAIPVAYNPAIPIGTFDFIIIDECHRSIYNQWRQVLDYFDAFIIGLTATPTKQTLGFFNQNLVAEYDHKAAVADNVNVGFDVYTILTKITVQGAQLEKEPEFFVPHRDRRSKATIHKELDETVTYAPGELDRDVVAEDQIRLIIKTFKDRLFTDIFPGRTEVPKTLIFAKTDLHADDIVKIVREEFGRGNEFCQKITSKSHKPDDLLQSFRNTYNPRIAVTVDMIATGTDVKPLECLIFMRNIKSWSYFEQMKGRGSRVIDANSLKSVTPDAACKTRFVIVDAVGLCKQDKNQSKPLDRQPTVTLERVLKEVSKGVVHPDLASTLGAKISRLAGSRSDAWHADIEKQTSGQPVSQLISTLFDSVDADKNRELAASKFSVTPDAVTDNQLDEIEALRVREALLPFHNPQLREILLRPEHQVIDKFTRDQLLTSSFDPEAKQRAETLVTSFRQFIEDNKDEIEAISILYSRPHSAGLRYSQIKDLARRLSIKPFHVDESQPQTLLKLWQAFGAVHPDKVDTNGKHCKHIVDLVALVRHAIDPESPLRPVGQTVEERFTEWLSDQQQTGGEFTEEQMQWLLAIKDHIASSLMIEQDDFEYAPFNQFGGIGRAYELFGDRLAEIMEELNARLAA
jgi:type I restriction enzyme R subunit